MGFADWKGKKQQAATATVATLATVEPKKALKNDNPTLCVADVASVAVAVSEKEQNLETITKTGLLPNSHVFGGGYPVILANCTTCNNCDHLTLTGTCQRLSKRVIPEALRECTFFELRQKERLSVVKTTPYTQDELNRLLNQAAKPLYHHLIDCQQCSLEDARYCVEGFGLGNTFDCLLLCFDDAADKRYELMNQVIKARVSGRRAFESLFSDNAPLPRQDAPITRKWGNTKEYEAFINHWTACEVCKPNLGRYCSEGQRLKKEANC